MRASRQLSGLLFLALAAVLAWGANVDPHKSIVRWIAVAALAAWGIWTLRQQRTRIEQVYQQILAMGLSIGAVGWLIPATESRGLLAIGGILVLGSTGLLLWSWIQRRRAPPAPPAPPAPNDDANRPG